MNRMLQQDPEARPSIDQLLALPQLQVGQGQGGPGESCGGVLHGRAMNALGCCSRARALVAGSPPPCRADPRAACLASPRAALQSRMSLLPQELESQISQHSISFDCMEVRWAALLCCVARNRGLHPEIGWAALLLPRWMRCHSSLHAACALLVLPQPARCVPADVALKQPCVHIKALQGIPVLPLRPAHRHLPAHLLLTHTSCSAHCCTCRASPCCRRSRCRRTWRSSTTACRPHGARQGLQRVPPALCSAALQRGYCMHARHAHPASPLPASSTHCPCVHVMPCVLQVQL